MKEATVIGEKMLEDWMPEMLRCTRFFGFVSGIVASLLRPWLWVFTNLSMLAPTALTNVGFGGGVAAVTVASLIAVFAAMRGSVLISGLGGGGKMREEGFRIISRVLMTGLSYDSSRVMSLVISFIQLFHIWEQETSSGRFLSI